MRDVIALILGGGRGTRLFPLTKTRSKPAVPLAGNYRLVDVTVSNCINSGIDRIYVLTQFNSASLNQHISKTYRFDAFSSGFVEVFAAEQTPSSVDWFQGTADAVRKVLPHAANHDPADILILSGDHLYRMDYVDFLARHRIVGADITIAVKPVPANRAPELGILQGRRQGPDHRVPREAEGEASRRYGRTRAPSGSRPPRRNRPYLGSMGVYSSSSTCSAKRSNATSADRFRKESSPTSSRGSGSFYVFDGYWEDIGTIRRSTRPIWICWRLFPLQPVRRAAPALHALPVSPRREYGRRDRPDPPMSTALASPVAFREKAPEPLFGEGLPPASAQLLQARIKDLKLHLAGTRLEKFIHQLYEEAGSSRASPIAPSATSPTSGAAPRESR